jgi:hypothetical protein
MGAEMKAVIFAAKVPRTGKPGAGFETFALSDMKRTLAGLDEETLVYVDVRGLADSDRRKHLGAAVKLAGMRVGILDTEGRVDDVAALFHAGAVDYVGKALGAAALTTKRLKAVAAYAALRAEAAAPPPVAAAAPELAAPTAGDGWASIKEGQEHTFAFLFIEVDDAEEMKKRYEPANLASAMETFRGFIERMVTPSGGRLWMWSRFGGLVLFPLRESECPALLCGLKILLSRVFYDAEESPLPGMLSFRMALSTGTTVYHANDTGKIVSDVINSIFHLGRRYAKPGAFLVSSEAAALAPEPLRPCLVPAGTYEGRRILRMLQPVQSIGARE